MSPWGIERYGQTWVFKQKVRSVLHWNLGNFFIHKNFSKFFRFFAFLQYLGTLRIFLLSKLFAWENILTVFARYPKLPNHATIHTSVLFRSIFGKNYANLHFQLQISLHKILTQKLKNKITYPSRISSVQGFGSSGFFSLDEPRNDPIVFAAYPKMFMIISNIV